MKSYSERYHWSIYQWSIYPLLGGIARGGEGLVAGIIICLFLLSLTAFVRAFSLVALKDDHLHIKKFSSSFVIPYNNISNIEFQKSAFGNYGIVRIYHSGGSAVLVKRVPRVAEFVSELQLRMKRETVQAKT